jgi:hypothetical protein
VKHPLDCAELSIEQVARAIEAFPGMSAAETGKAARLLILFDHGRLPLAKMRALDELLERPMGIMGQQ